MFFSTHNVRRRDRLDAWKEALAGHCGSFQAEAASQDFEASFEMRNVGDLRCSRLMQSSGSARRTICEIGSNLASEYRLIMLVAGQASMFQEGRRADLRPGGLTLINLMEPSLFEFSRKSVLLSLHVPKARFGSDFERLRFATDLPGLNRALVGPLIRSSFDHGQSRKRCGTAISEAIVGLVAASWDGSEPENDYDLDKGSALLTAIQDYALNHLEEDVTPSRLARAHNVSDRHLHRLFQAHGLSVCRWILQNRLDRCAADLGDPRLQHQTITEIAFRWGFNNVAHFSRAFRAQFDQAPRDFRASARIR